MRWLIWKRARRSLFEWESEECREEAGRRLLAETDADFLNREELAFEIPEKVEECCAAIEELLREWVPDAPFRLVSVDVRRHFYYPRCYEWKWVISTETIDAEVQRKLRELHAEE